MNFLTLMLKGLKVFVPIQCLPERRKMIIKGIIENGLDEILIKAFGKSKWFKRKQDQLDPYLGAFYNSYSLAAGFTQPYINGDAPTRIFFKVNVRFIPEGEEDQVQVKYLLSIIYSVIIYNVRSWRY